ncbi:sulfhydryl oxidase 1 [Osmerus mordax]|uniref:sulfhydryl oxidase 1 n=1 Tax=Osmerus mordax TaxID=8014 RepID=UPI00350F2353
MARRYSRATSWRTGNTLSTNARQLLILTILVYTGILSPFTAEAGLYTASDQIVILTTENADTVLFNSTAAMVVEFYASWCGHCIGFSPVYKSLARDIKEWKPAVDLGAIDCAEEQSRKICTNFGIKGYPTLKFFHAYGTSDSKGQSFRGFPRDVKGLRQNIIEKMENHQEPWPPACPPLEPASLAEIDSFFESNSVQHLALIFEASNSYVGREVTLDLLQYDNIAVRRVLSTEEVLVSRLEVTDFPSCFLYYPGGNHTRLRVQNEARTFYSYALQRLPGVVRTGKPRPLTSDLLGNTTDEQWRVFNRSRVYMADLESTLHFSLRVELASHPILRGDALSALRRYVSVLAKYFPGRPVVKNLLTAVDSWLQAQSQSEISYSDLRDVLDNTAEVPDAALPEGQNWVGCQGSKPHLRRYPCGVWTLFHVLTVQAKSSASTEPLEVLQAMRGYVHSFFGCRECATHFEAMAQDSLSQVDSASTAVLWLWSRHNHVNNRLAGAGSEDPLFPKTQWPTPDMCPACHGVKRGGEHAWKPAEVLSFLLSYFSSERLLPDHLEEESRLLAQQKEQREARRQEQEVRRGAERRAREASFTQPQEEEEDEEEEAQEDPADEEAGEGGGTLEPAPWVKPEAVAEEEGVVEGGRPSRQRGARSRPSVVGMKLREPQEDIVDLDSFVNQHYKAKALRVAAAVSAHVKRRSLQRREDSVLGLGLEAGPDLPGAESVDLGAGQYKRLQKRGLTSQYRGSEEEGVAVVQLYPHDPRGRWMNVLSVGFSGLDISLCVILYFLSSMCLLGMFLFFKMRPRFRRVKVAQP